MISIEICNFRNHLTEDVLHLLKAQSPVVLVSYAFTSVFSYLSSEPMEGTCTFTVPVSIAVDYM
jgi:hypothetical protein